MNQRSIFRGRGSFLAIIRETGHRRTELHIAPPVLLNADLRVVYSGGIGTAIVARGDEQTVVLACYQCRWLHNGGDAGVSSPGNHPGINHQRNSDLETWYGRVEAGKRNTRAICSGKETKWLT